MTLEQYETIIRERMGDKRFIHSVNVSKEAGILAELYGADPEKAKVAGMIHDITKETPPEEQLKIITDSGIILDEIEKNSSKLWHPISGACYIEKNLDIKDPDILNAVRYHTTGRAGMSLLEKIIFVSDFTSEERKYRDVDVMRMKAHTNLDEACVYGLQYTIKDLAQRAMTIHPNALAFYNEQILKG